MCGLLLLATTCICQINYRNGDVGILVLRLLPLLNPWLIVVMQPSEVFSAGITLVDVYLNWQNWLSFLILVGGPLVILIGCMIFLSPFLDVIRMSMSIAFFLQSLNFLLPGCFPLMYNQNGLMSRVIRHFLFLSFFKTTFPQAFDIFLLFFLVT